jgi:Mce-associated membrane protein
MRMTLTSRSAAGESGSPAASGLPAAGGSLPVGEAGRPAAEGTEAETTAARGGAGRARRGLQWVGGHRGQALLGGAIVLLAAAGTVLTVGTVQLRQSPPAANRALTDPSATRQVAAAVTGDLEQIFSYSYANLRPTQLAARKVLAGMAARQYGELFPELGSAVSQQLTVTSKVTYAGVTRLSGGSAQLLVFLNQTATRDATPATASPVHAQLAITAQFRDGRWRIVAIAAR